MRVGVIGSNGMLGYGVSVYFENFVGIDVVKIDRAKFDVLKDDMGVLYQLIDCCDVVINCIGIIKPMIDKHTVGELIHVNCVFPKNLAKICNSLCIKCFHISTDCAYSGKKGSYDETDEFDVNDLYGMTKIAGETSECMTIRTSIVGEEKGDGKSLLSWFISQRDKEVNGFNNHIWNGVTTTHLAHLIRCIIYYDHYKKGVFHIFTKESVNKYELLCLFNDIYDLNININEVSSDTPCDRSLDTIYDVNSTLPIYNLERQIREMKDIFSK